MLDAIGYPALAEVSGYVGQDGFRLACEAISRHYRQRCLIERCNTVVASLKAADGAEVIDKNVSFLERAIESVDDSLDGEELSPRGQELSHFLEDQSIEIQRVRWPVSDLQIACDLTTQHFCVLAAYPGAGKTSMAIQLAESVAKDADEPGSVLFFTLEMAKHELDAIWLAARLGCTSQDILMRRLLPEQLAEASKVMAEWQERKDVVVHDCVGDTTVAGIVRTIRTHKRRYPGARLCIIDYLQLIDRAQGEDLFTLVSTATRVFKKLQAELGICIVILSQFSKDGTKDKDRRPSLSALKRASDIEANATSICFMHTLGINGDGSRRIEFSCMKNRHGSIGDNSTKEIIFDAPKGQVFRSVHMTRAVDRHDMLSVKPSETEDLFA